MLHPPTATPHCFAAEGISHGVRPWQRKHKPYKFFIDNKEGFPTEKIFPNKDNMESLMDFREILGDIAERLEEASSDDLLIAPLFLLQVVDELNKDAE
jgi:hypothetical protein